MFEGTLLNPGSVAASSGWVDTTDDESIPTTPPVGVTPPVGGGPLLGCTPAPVGVMPGVTPGVNPGVVPGVAAAGVPAGAVFGTFVGTVAAFLPQPVNSSNNAPRQQAVNR